MQFSFVFFGSEWKMQNAVFCCVFLEQNTKCKMQFSFVFFLEQRSDFTFGASALLALVAFLHSDFLDCAFLECAFLECAFL